MRYFLLAISVLLVLSSCKKLESTTTKEDWLRVGQWHYSSGNIKMKVLFSSPSRDTTINLDSAYKKTCYSDNALTFGADYGGNVSTGSTKCIPGEADQIPFHWELTNNYQDIIIYNAGSFFGVSEINPGSGNSINATVTSFSQNSISIQYHDVYEVTNPTNKFNTIRDTLTYSMTLMH